MANIYKNAMFDLTTTDKTNVYTCPTDRTALVKSIHIYNEGAGDAIVTIKINSNSVDYFYSKKTIAADATHEFVVNILVLQENDKLKMLSDITGPDITVSLLETNREDL